MPAIEPIALTPAEDQSKDWGDEEVLQELKENKTPHEAWPYPCPNRRQFYLDPFSPTSAVPFIETLKRLDAFFATIGVKDKRAGELEGIEQYSLAIQWVRQFFE